ncbi:MAG: cytochrome-c peroxidase [Gammaproteobacteria bacterium]
MKRLLLGGVVATAFAVSGTAFGDNLLEMARAQFKPIPVSLPAVKDNRVTREKVELGKMLFFDPRLSKSGLTSCNTCHNLGMGGDDNLETSVSHGWSKAPRNAPTVLNAVFNSAQFWDGRAEDLKSQAKSAIERGVGMNTTPERIVAVLKSIYEYEDRFKAAFPGESDPVTFENVTKAIEAFEATLITPNSRFDQYLDGNEKALTRMEKKGLRFFIEKGCSACHNGVNLGGHDYYPFGVVERPGADILPRGDKGRFAVTQTANDEYVFRSPQLRNVALTAPYFHSGKVWDLGEAVAIMGTSQLGTKLTEDEVVAITAFLYTLTGEQPRIEYPLLPAESPDTPKPEPVSMQKPEPVASLALE